MTQEGLAHTWHVWNRGIGWSIHVGPEVDPRGHEHCRDLMDADILGKGVFDEDVAALIVAAVNSFEALLDLAEEVSRTQPAAVEMFRRNGIVFDKWPPEIIPPERWNAETLAALDPEVRWQGIAFSLYTDLCQLASHADAAFPPIPDSTPDPLE